MKLKFPQSFILEYPAWWVGGSRCQITIYHPEPDTYVVISTELLNNPGIHIRQASANIATTIYYRLEASLPNVMLPQDMVFIENDPAEPIEAARWQRVVLRWETNRYFEYDRYPIQQSDVENLTGRQRRTAI